MGNIDQYNNAIIIDKLCTFYGFAMEICESGDQSNVADVKQSLALQMATCPDSN